VRWKWHRAGRRSTCEIHAVELGSFTRVSVTRDVLARDPTRIWLAHLNLGELGTFADLETAKARCDDILRQEARNFLEDWAGYSKAYPTPKSRQI